jgi:Transaldolase
MTKIFCDIADINLIREFNKKNIVKGFTTNPTLIRKSGAKDYAKYCKSILKVTKKPVSFEVFADDNKNIIKQAFKIKNWGKQVYVKIPVTNSKGVFLGKVINRLNSENIKLNITAVYTAEQTNRILKSINKKTKVIISIFAGRMADKGKDPIPEIKKSILFAKKYKNVEILWASVKRAL